MNFSPVLQLQLRQQLTDILNELQLTLSASVQDKIIHFLDLLVLWNKSYNLTAIRDPEEMMIKHIADSLAVVPFIKAHRIIDIGSGAGFPGIPLALFFSETQWTLLDSNGKKTRFLLQAKAELKLSNVEVVQARIDEYRPQHCYDGLISRAWTQLDLMLPQIHHVCCQPATLWVMKGKYPQEELEKIKQPYQVQALQVPGLSDERHLVSITLNGTDNEKL